MNIYARLLLAVSPWVSEFSPSAPFAAEGKFGKKCNHETCGGPTHSLDLLSGDPEVVGENRGPVPLLQRRQWAPALSSIASALMYL